MDFPKEFIEYTSRLFGEERWQKFLGSFSQETPVSVRYNPFKPVSDMFDGEIDRRRSPRMAETLAVRTPIHLKMLRALLRRDIFFPE